MTLARIAYAASPSWDESIEFQAAVSDRVIRGRILSVNTADPPGVEATNGRWRRITVLVDEALKGPAAADAEFFELAPLPGWDDPDWLASKDESLLFLVTGPRRAAWERRREYGVSPLTLEGGRAPVCLRPSLDRAICNVNLVDFSSRDEILAAARSRCGQGVSSQWITIAVYKGWRHVPSWPSLMVVPIDAMTEATARAWAPARDAQSRFNAVRILSRRKSEENIAALRQAVAARVCSSEDDIAQLAALQTLSAWGAAPAEVSDVREWRGLTALSALSIIVVLAVVAVYSHRCLHPPKYSLANGTRILCVTACAVVLAMWARSYVEVDGLSGGNWELAAGKGDLVVIYRARSDITLTRPWRFSSADHLWAVQDLDHRSYERLAISRWVFTLPLDQSSAWPEWLGLIGVAVPFWFIFSAMAVVPVSVFALTVYKAQRLRKRRGFPVQLVVPRLSARMTKAAPILSPDRSCQNRSTGVSPVPDSADKSNRRCTPTANLKMHFLNLCNL